jgi:excisionase family DNA binding protein
MENHSKKHHQLAASRAARPSELYTRQEAASLLGLSAATLAKWASTGERIIPYIRLGGQGGRVRYRGEDLAEFIESSPQRAS